MLLLLLLGSLAVGLAINTFHRLALLALGTVPLLVTLHAPPHSLLPYGMFRSAFTPAVLALWVASCSSAALPCSLVPAAATDLESRRFAVRWVQHPWPQSQIGPVVAGL